MMKHPRVWPVRREQTVLDHAISKYELVVWVEFVKANGACWDFPT